MIAFRLDFKSGVPIYRQIQDQIRFGLASGRLAPGEQLPTVRALAVDLGVNPNTVIKAYSELEHEGLLTSEQGSGTFISGTAPLAIAPKERRKKIESLCGEFLAQAAQYGFSPDEVVEGIRFITERKM